MKQLYFFDIICIREKTQRQSEKFWRAADKFSGNALVCINVSLAGTRVLALARRQSHQLNKPLHNIFAFCIFIFCWWVVGRFFQKRFGVLVPCVTFKTRLQVLKTMLPNKEVICVHSGSDCKNISMSWRPHRMLCISGRQRKILQTYQINSKIELCNVNLFYVINILKVVVDYTPIIWCFPLNAINAKPILFA